MPSNRIPFSPSLSSKVDILIYKVADMDRRRDRSIPRGNDGENYEGTRTHFTYLPRRASRARNRGRKSTVELAGIRVWECDTRSISRRKQFLDRRVSKILGRIPPRDSNRVRHPETFVERASWKKMFAMLWFSLRPPCAILPRRRREQIDASEKDRAQNSRFAYILAKVTYNAPPMQLRPDFAHEILTLVFSPRESESSREAAARRGWLLTRRLTPPLARRKIIFFLPRVPEIGRSVAQGAAA